MPQSGTKCDSRDGATATGSTMRQRGLEEPNGRSPAIPREGSRRSRRSGFLETETAGAAEGIPRSSLAAELEEKHLHAPLLVKIEPQSTIGTLCCLRNGTTRPSAMDLVNPGNLTKVWRPPSFQEYRVMYPVEKHLLQKDAFQRPEIDLPDFRNLVVGKTMTLVHPTLRQLLPGSTDDPKTDTRIESGLTVADGVSVHRDHEPR